MAITEEKFKSILKSYQSQLKECASIQVQVDGYCASLEVKQKAVTNKKKLIEEILKPAHNDHLKEETKLLESLKNHEKDIKAEKCEKNESYLKIVAAEDAIRNFREQDRLNLRINIEELERCADQAFVRRTSLRDMIMGAKRNCDTMEVVSQFLFVTNDQCS